MDEPFINSGIKFEKSEINNNMDVFSKSPFGDSDFENGNTSGNFKFENTSGNFPDNKVQKQVSSSSEEFNFEGSKVSKSTTSGGISKSPEVQTWESAKGEAKVSKSNETFEYEPGQNQKSKAHLSNKKLKSHNSSPSFFSPMNNERKSNNSSISSTASDQPQSPSARDIVLALNSLMSQSECQALGKDFARNLSEALKEVYASKQSDKDKLQSPVESEFAFHRSLKPRLSLKQGFENFGGEGKLKNDGINFSVAESENFSSASNLSRFEQKTSESLYDSSKSNSFAESNGFSRLSKSFQKKESSETKRKNRKSSLKMSTSSNADQRKEVVEESSKSSSNSRRSSCKSSVGFPEQQKQTSNWSGMIKPDTKDKSVQITPQKLDRTAVMQLSSQPKLVQHRLTQTETSLIDNVNLNFNPDSKTKVKCAAKLLPPTPNLDSKNENVKFSTRIVDKSSEKTNNTKSSHENITSDGFVNEVQDETEKSKAKFDSPFFYHGSVRKRRVLPNPHRNYTAASNDSDFIRNSSVRISLPNSLTSLQNQKEETSNGNSHNWKRSMSTPEIRAWTNTIKWLEEDNVDSYKCDGEPSVHINENKDISSKPVEEPKDHRHSTKIETDDPSISKNLNASLLPPPSVDLECCADKRSSRCCSPLHGISSSVSTKKNANREENKSNNTKLHVTSSANHPLLITSKSSDNSSSSKKTSSRSRLKSDSSLIHYPESGALSSTQEHRRTKDAFKHRITSGHSSKLSKQSADHSYSKNGSNHTISHKSSDNRCSVSNRKVSTSMMQNTLDDKPPKLAARDSNLFCDTSDHELFDSAGFSGKFPSEIKLLKSKKPRKYVTKQVFNDLDNHVINSESMSALRQVSPSTLCNSNNQSDIFETDDFTYIIRPKGRSLRAQGV